MLAVAAALAMCGRVDLYGFGTSVFAGNGHYYALSAAPVMEWKVHSFDAEQLWYRELEVRARGLRVLRRGLLLALVTQSFFLHSH